MISARHILLDLDGTLIDPKLGITKSILYALEKMGVQSSPNDSLDWCIGPPLHLSMRKLLSSTDEGLVNQAVGFFAERFETIGKYEGLLYPGTTKALGRIQQLGQKMYLATSKPQNIASDILKHFGLESYFDGVYGSVHDKAALVAHILQVESIDPADALMVGDREHDVISAQKCFVRSVGVTYGYGSADELKAAKPDYLFDSLDEFVNTLAQLE
jgi:phosphoglycolate phosphatase